MTDDAVPAAARVPTLTEVIDAADPSSRQLPGGVDWAAASVIAGAQALRSPPAAATALPAGQDHRLQDALAAALARFDAGADARLREALQPILAEAADRLVAAARSELASSLRDLMAAQVDADLDLRHTASPDPRGADPSPF